MGFAGDTWRIVAAKTKASDQTLAHTSQTGLQQLNHLAYPLAVTTNTRLELDLSLTQLSTV